jgi:metal-responsive CopG/Arc/MetJ family transcriptional regulator
MMENTIMVARSVQISVDADLLAEVDRQDETKKHGRSAFIREALLMRLHALRNAEVDARYARGYAGKAKTLLQDLGPLRKRQAWPEE